MHAILILATVVGLAASPARAPSADEQRLYDEGLRAFQSGDARAAEKAWKAGYAVAHDPAFLVHIGEAQEKAGAPAEAVDTYRHYLREAPDAADRADIEQRLARLAPAPASAPARRPHTGRDATAGRDTGRVRGDPAEAVARPALATRRDDPPRHRPATPSTRTAPRSPRTAAGTATTSRRSRPLRSPSCCWAPPALFAAKAGSDESDVNRLVQYRDPGTGAPLRYSSVSGQYQQATADGPDHDRDAKIALAASAVMAAVSITFFVLDAKLGVTPAVAIVPDGRGVAGSGGLQWRF